MDIASKKWKKHNKGFVLFNIIIFIVLLSSMLIGEAILYNIIAVKTNEIVFESHKKNDLESSCINYISGRFSTRWIKDEYSSTGSYRFKMEEFGEHYKFYFYNTLYPDVGYYIIFDNLLSSDNSFVIFEDGYYEVEHELDS